MDRVGNDESLTVVVHSPEENNSRIWLKVPTNPDPDESAIEFSGRAFELLVQSLKTPSEGSISTETVTAIPYLISGSDDDMGDYSEALEGDDYRSGLPGFASLRSKGRFVWVEPRTPNEYRYVSFEVGNIQDAAFKITLAKPDFAIVGQPVISTTSQGAVTVSAPTRNSTSQSTAALDSSSYLEVICRIKSQPMSPERYRFSYLRDSGDTYLIGSKRTVAVEVPALCLGADATTPLSVTATTRLHTGGLEQAGVVSRVVEPGDADDWHRNANTLWRPQQTIIGGLQLNAGRRNCTLSFPLTIRKVAGGKSTIAFSTTAHCAETRNSRTYSSIGWVQGSKTRLDNVELGIAELLPTTGLTASERYCAIRVEGSSELTELTDCHFGDHAYATINRSDLPPSNPSRPEPAISPYIFHPMEENTHGNFDLETDFFIPHSHSDGNHRFKIVGARPPAPGDKVNKVGRTTGWTSGSVPMYRREDPAFDEQDPSCPGANFGTGRQQFRGRAPQFRVFSSS